VLGDKERLELKVKEEGEREKEELWNDYRCHDL